VPPLEISEPEIVQKEEEVIIEAWVIQETISTSSLAEIFVQKILEWGVKQNLIPLLRTADITLENEILTIKTTGFAETMCRKNENWLIIENVWNWLGAKTIQITLLDEIKEDESKDISPLDAAAEIFG
jgi:hypothetical protein